MGANKMNSLSEPFATSFLLHLNRQDLKKMIISHQLWMDLLWVLGGSDDSFHCLDLDSVWIWITPSSHHDYDFFDSDLKYVTLHISKVQADVVSLDYVSLYE